MSKQTDRVFYLRDPKTITEFSRGNPIGLVLYRVSEDNKRISYVYSVCSPLDVFNKKIAMGIIENRMKEKWNNLASEVPYSNFEVQSAILLDIKDNNLERRKAGGVGLAKYGRSYTGMMSVRAWFSRQAILQAKKAKEKAERQASTEMQAQEQQQKDISNEQEAQSA